MNKNILIAFLVLFSLSSIVSATLVLSPNPLEVETKANNMKNFSFTITNNYTFDILDFSFPVFESKGFIFPEISMPKKTTNTYQFSVKTNESFYGTLEEKVEFKFWVDLPEEITTHKIVITEYGFEETYLTIRKGDIVEWENKDTISHLIKSTEFGSITINPNQTNTFTFNNLGNIFYYDDFWGDFLEFQGILEVVEGTEKQKAHNPNYDQSWLINLNSIAELTNLSVLNSKHKYNIETLNSDNGLITIENTGDKKAEGIKVTSTSNWITFEDNKKEVIFDLEAGKTEWVEYTILPTIYTTNETGKNYSIEITVKAFNTDKARFNLTIEIPYKEITDNIESDFDYAMWLQNSWCPLHPCSVQCSPELPECSANYQNSNYSNILTFNGTSYDLYDLKRDLGVTKNSVLRLENERKSWELEYGGKIDKIGSETNESLSESKESKETEKGRLNLTWGFIAFIIVFGVILLIIKKEHKSSRKKNITGESYKYRQ